MTFQAYDERPPHRDRLRCALCRRWTRHWVVQGLDNHPDADATSRHICDPCAKAHLQQEIETKGQQ